jgi:hypothetical protein
MNYSSPRSSAPVVLRLDGVEYDVSNLLIQSEKHDDRPRRSQSIQIERHSPYIGKKAKAKSSKSLMSKNQEKKEDGLKKSPLSHQYSSSSLNSLKSPPPSSPVREEEEERRRARREEMYNHTPTVEIAPGVCEILRGSVETKQAIQSGAITQVRCCCCTQTVHCIEDAAFFICPTCSVISQVPHGSWGVGLGFLRPL